MKSPLSLTHREARAFYDRFGAKQDKQGFYEDPAIECLLANAELKSVARILEFDCGTGRLAERMLRREATSDANYIGLDVSPVMADLARTRLIPFANRAAVHLTDGSIEFPVPNASVDFVISTYVMDLLSDEDIRHFLQEARRVLRPGGRIGLVSITTGTTFVSRAVMAACETVYRVRPSLIGGCRPITLTAFVRRPEWSILYRHVVMPFGIASEIVVATAMLEAGPTAR